jgi:hypothetical protein
MSEQFQFIYEASHPPATNGYERADRLDADEWSCSLKNPYRPGAPAMPELPRVFSAFSTAKGWAIQEKACQGIVSGVPGRDRGRVLDQDRAGRLVDDPIGSTTSEAMPRFGLSAVADNDQVEPPGLS